MVSKRVEFVSKERSKRWGQRAKVSWVRVRSRVRTSFCCFGVGVSLLLRIDWRAVVKWIVKVWYFWR